MTSKYVHTFVKTFGRGSKVLRAFGNFTTWQIEWLKRRFGKLAFFMEGSCIIWQSSLWKWDLSSKPLSDTMFGQALSFNLDKDKTHHRWRLCFDRNFSAIHMTVQLIFIFKDVRSLLKLQPHFHLRPGYSVHNWKIVCWRAAESMNQGGRAGTEKSQGKPLNS